MNKILPIVPFVLAASFATPSYGFENPFSKVTVENCETKKAHFKEHYFKYNLLGGFALAAFAAVANNPNSDNDTDWAAPTLVIGGAFWFPKIDSLRDLDCDDIRETQESESPFYTQNNDVNAILESQDLQRVASQLNLPALDGQ